MRELKINERISWEYLWNDIKKSTICVIGVPEKKKNVEKMAEKISNLMNTINPQIPRTQ